MPDSREVAARIIDLVFHTEHIDAGTPLEELHLLEQIADELDEAFGEYEREINRLQDGETV
jgi:hypothetical protein